MIDIIQELTTTTNALRLLRTLIIIVIALIVFKIILSIIKKNLLKKAQTRKQITNIELFSRVMEYSFLGLLVIFAIFSFAGSWTGLGVSLGLVSAALGWALQKPITGFAAWIMVVTRRPFDIGDRVIIGNMKGDVLDISLTHIYLHEVGGALDGEEGSGRTILVPNSTLFEQNIINYTYDDEYILDQIVVTVTYESNLDKAEKIMEDAAKLQLKKVIKKTKKIPYTRVSFDASGITISVRYHIPAKRPLYYKSLITKGIYEQFKKHKDVHFAYPHMEVVMKKK